VRVRTRGGGVKREEGGRLVGQGGGLLSFVRHEEIPAEECLGGGKKRRGCDSRTKTKELHRKGGARVIDVKK